MTFNLYPRPIPDADLQPPPGARDLRAVPLAGEVRRRPPEGDHLRQEDETNTALKTVLLMRVGGVQGRQSQGIHWHVDPGVRIRYRSDPTRETIYDVELTRADGTVKTFSSPDSGEQARRRVAGDGLRGLPQPPQPHLPHPRARPRRGDRGGADRPLPPLRPQGGAGADHQGLPIAATRRRRRSRRRWRPTTTRTTPTSPPARRRSSSSPGAACGRPTRATSSRRWESSGGPIRTTSATTDSPGCFRCHDDQHAAKDGETIAQDCFTCHNLLAMEEENPAVLKDLQP